MPGKSISSAACSTCISTKMDHDVALAANVRPRWLRIVEYGCALPHWDFFLIRAFHSHFIFCSLTLFAQDANQGGIRSAREKKIDLSDGSAGIRRGKVYALRP